MRFRLTLKDYQDLANANDLEYLDDRSQRRIVDICNWKCRRCGRKMEKSYKAVKYYPNACICRSGKTLSVSDYEELASRLSKYFKVPILFSKLNQVPKNVDQEVLWELPKHSRTFKASYYRMSYHGVHSRIKDLIEEAEGEKNA